MTEMLHVFLGNLPVVYTWHYHFHCLVCKMSHLYEILSTLSHSRILFLLVVIAPRFYYKSDRYGDGFGKRKFSAEKVSQEAVFISSCSLPQMCSLEVALGLPFHFFRAVEPEFVREHSTPCFAGGYSVTPWCCEVMFTLRSLIK